MFLITLSKLFNNISSFLSYALTWQIYGKWNIFIFNCRLLLCIHSLWMQCLPDPVLGHVLFLENVWLWLRRSQSSPHPFAAEVYAFLLSSGKFPSRFYILLEWYLRILVCFWFYSCQMFVSYCWTSVSLSLSCCQNEWI